VAYGWLRLADSHYRQARYDAAEQDIRQAQAILDKLPNCTRNHGRVNTSLGMIFVKTGRLREAEPLLGKGLAIAEQKSPQQSNYVAAALGGLGECLTAAKRYAEAEPHLIESL
jgi:tetratricopeptide (TPR) repeat protein